MQARSGIAVVVLLALGACAPPDARLEAGPLASTVVRCPALPATLDLGQVPVGGVSSARLGGLGAEVVLTADNGFTVRREGAEVIVEAHPSAAGTVEGTLSATTPSCPAATSRLIAMGMPRCLEVAPALAFADTERSCGTVTATLAAHNRCDVDVALHGGGVVEPADGAEAWCPGGPPCQEFGLVNGDRVLAAGATSSLTLRFSPASSGARTGDLRLEAVERRGVAEYLVTLSGLGLARERVTERFDVPAAFGRGDLLVIVDASPSMNTRREATATNFAHFGKYLVASQMDVQVTVASADRALAGATVGTTNSLEAGFEAKFAQLVDAVPPGSENTSCMEQALTLLEATPSFRRAEVPVTVVCVTDGPDHAALPWQTLLGRLLAGVDTPQAMIVGAFSPVAGCASELDNGRLTAWSNMTYGVREEICAANWASALSNVGRTFFGWFFWASPSRPALRIVEVTVDGTPLPAVDANGGSAWAWNPVMRAIVFEPLYTPAPGQVVGVTYEPSCP